jgi:hypothetical protein
MASIKTGMYIPPDYELPHGKWETVEEFSAPTLWGALQKFMTKNYEEDGTRLERLPKDQTLAQQYCRWTAYYAPKTPSTSDPVTAEPIDIDKLHSFVATIDERHSLDVAIRPETKPKALAHVTSDNITRGYCFEAWVFDANAPTEDPLLTGSFECRRNSANRYELKGDLNRKGQPIYQDQTIETLSSDLPDTTQIKQLTEQWMLSQWQEPEN